MSAYGGKADVPDTAPKSPLIARSGHSRRCPTSPEMSTFNIARTLRRMFDGSAYLDRAAPRFAPAKFLASGFTRGLFIELAPGSNCPGRISWPGRSALASRFLAFCAAFAFARWRALALVISSWPFSVALWNFPTWCRSTGEHGQCGLAVSWLQSKKQLAGFLDVLFGTTLGGRLEGNRSRMIRSADENQSFSQAPHGCTVDLCFFHSGVPPGFCLFRRVELYQARTHQQCNSTRPIHVPGRHGCRCQEDPTTSISGRRFGTLIWSTNSQNRTFFDGMSEAGAIPDVARAWPERRVLATRRLLVHGNSPALWHLDAGGGSRPQHQIRTLALQ